MLARRGRVRGERGRGAGLGRGPPGGAAGARRLGRGLPQRGGRRPRPAQFGPGRAFLASKLSDRAHLSYDGAKARVAETLRFFGVETVDLYSLHSAFNFLHDAKARADLAGAWRALVELQKKGTLRALGVSNFNAVELRAFAEDPALGGLWLPDALQNKVDVYRRGEQEPGEDDVLAAAKELDIAAVAYSSRAAGRAASARARTRSCASSPRGAASTCRR